jgi:putative ABC transport system permease protein
MSHRSDRLFRAFLKLFPAEFRGAYGREMETAFRDERRQARGPMTLLGLWIEAITDVLKTAPSEHWDIFRRDTRFALRAARSRPAHTLAAVFTLAIGLGACVVMFSVVDAVLFAPLDYRDADAIVAIQETSPRFETSNLGYQTFLDVQARSRSFAAMAAVSQSFPTLAGDGRDAERVATMRASATYLDVLGVAPALGRGFTAAEDKPGAARRVAILSDALWRRRFGADPAILGKPILLSDTPFTVVGVMPRGFEDLYGKRFYNDAQMWTPLGYDPTASFACRTCRHLGVVARLTPAATADSARQEVRDLLAALGREHPTEYDQPSATLVGLRDLLLGPVRPILTVLAAGVVGLLLVACFTVANLLLLRATDRAREIAVRTALGVSPGRMARQLITESVLLAATGALAGILPAFAVIRWLATSGPAQLPRIEHVGLDARALLAGLALALTSGVLFGLAPMRQWQSRNLALDIHGGGRTTSGKWRLRAGLVSANVALALLLLVGSGLLVRNLLGLLAVEPGFDASQVLTMQVVLAGEEYSDEDEAKAIAKTVGFYDRVLERIRALPGVETAAGVTTLPLGGGIDGFGLHLASRPLENPESAPSADRFVVTPDYFAASGTPLRGGRLLDRRDDQAAAKVVVVNERLARELFAGRDPLGEDVMLGPVTADRRTIVGVVADVRHRGLDSPPEFQVYVPQAQWAWAETGLTLVVRAAHDIADPAVLGEPIRRVIRDLDPRQPVTAVRTWDEIVAASTGTRRLSTALLSFFAAAAFVLSIFGLYGAVSVLVGQQEREIGVRLVLGARVAEIRRMVLSRGLQPVAVGLAAGTVAALLGMAALESWLAGIEGFDPATFAAALLTLTGAAAVACAIPAERAARTDPATTLRSE